MLLENAADRSRPRLKPIYPLYRLDQTRVRVGAQRGLTVEFRDPAGQVWELLHLADGSRSLAQLIADMRTRFPQLSAEDVVRGLAEMDRAGLLDDATFDEASASLARFEGNVNHFRHFGRLGDDPWLPQRTLRQRRVALFGLGGGGSVILPLLAAAGVGSIVAVDYDRVEESNLNRQWLFGEADIGDRKTAAAARALARMNSRTELRTVDRKIEYADDAVDLLRGADLAICAIDEPPFLAQRRVNAAAVAEGVPCLFGGSQVTRGRMFTVVPGTSGCFDCLNIHYTKTSVDFVAQFRGFHAEDFSPPTIAFPPDVVRLGSAMVAEAVRLLTGYLPPASVGAQVEFDFVTGGTETLLTWPRFPEECPTCGAGSEAEWPVFAMYPGTTWRPRERRPA